MSRQQEHDCAFSIRVSSEVKAAMKEAAKAEDIDVAAWIRRAINEKLQRDNGKIDDDFEEAVIQVIDKMIKEGKL